MTQSEYDKMMERATQAVRELNLYQPADPEQARRLITSIEEIRQHAAQGLRVATDEEGLNKTEKRYLAWLRTLNDPWIGIQNLTFKVAKDYRYTPDFIAVDRAGIRAVDTKGTKSDGTPLLEGNARDKIITTAKGFPWCRFLLAFETGGVWQHKEISP